MSIRFAKVVATYPRTRSVDLVFSDTGERSARVQVMTSNASSDGGTWDVPDVPKPSSEQAAGELAPSGRSLVACVAFNGRSPVVIGFMHTLDGQMAFGEQNRQVYRHPSGAYTTVAPDGSIETYHPSGAYLRIGTGDHQDLAAVSADGNWQIPAGAPPAQVTLATSGFKLTVQPGGECDLVTAGKLSLTYATAEMHGPVKIFGALEVTDDVTGGTISLQGHVHGGVQGGPGTTAPPQA